MVQALLVAARSRRRPTTPPTRSPSRSATPTTRRCAAPRRRRTWRARSDRARRRRGRGPPRRPRRARDRRRRRLPAGRLGRDAAPGPRASGAPVSLHAHLVVRDDTLQLYGFATEEERDLFLLLLGVQARRAEGRARGPQRRHRRASWRPRSPPATRRASRPCPGIGKRTAERIVVELREKVAPADGLRARDRRHPRRRPARASPATACSSSASRPPRPTRCSRVAEGDSARGAAAERAEGRAALSGRRRRPRIQTPGALAGEDELDRSLRPRTLEDFVGQEALREQLAVSLEAAAARGEALDHVLLAGPPGPGQDVAGADHRRRARRAVRADRRPGARAQGRHRRAAHRARAARGLLRRRDPPAQPRAGGDLLPGDGGPRGCRSRSARARARGSSRSTCRRSRSSARRPAPGLLTTPLRDRFGIQHRLEPYEPADLARIVHRSADILGVRDRRRRRARRSPRAAAARRAWPTACCKRVRDWAEVRGTRRRRRRAPPTRRWTCSRSTRAASTASTATSSARICTTVRGRPRRPLDARHRGRRGGGHDRGRLRALSAPARAPPAHAARARRDGARLRAPRARPAARERRCSGLAAGPLAERRRNLRVFGRQLEARRARGRAARPCRWRSRRVLGPRPMLKRRRARGRCARR